MIAEIHFSGFVDVVVAAVAQRDPRLHLISYHPHHRTKVNSATHLVPSIFLAPAFSCAPFFVSCLVFRLFHISLFFTRLSRRCRDHRLDSYDLVLVWINSRLSLCPGLRLSRHPRAKAWLAASHITRPGRFPTLARHIICNSPFTLRDAPPSGHQPRATDAALLLHFLQPFNSPVQTSQDTSLSPFRGRNFSRPLLARQLCHVLRSANPR